MLILTILLLSHLNTFEFKSIALAELHSVVGGPACCTYASQNSMQIILMTFYNYNPFYLLGFKHCEITTFVFYTFIHLK